MSEIILGQPREEPRPSYTYAENMHVVYRDVLAKTIAYTERFGVEAMRGHEAAGYLLPLGVCQDELLRAEKQLLFEGARVDCAKMVSHDYNPAAKNVGFEIGVNGRRFAIPRDQFTPHPHRDLINIETAVVSVLDWTRWPENPRFEITPKISDALLDIATWPLIDDVRDLAVYLQLGDRVPFGKKNLWKNEVFERALDKFGVDDIEQVKKILKSIGLKIIDTSERFSQVVSFEHNTVNSEVDNTRLDVLKTLGLKAMFVSHDHPKHAQSYGMNGRTEVDALLEAIHKTS